jgi:hypothetical protein
MDPYHQVESATEAIEIKSGYFGKVHVSRPHEQLQTINGRVNIPQSLSVYDKKLQGQGLWKKMPKKLAILHHEALPQGQS